MKELTDYFRRLDNVEKTIRKMPARIASVAVKFSKDRFVEQRWINHRTENWKQGQFPKRKGQAILVNKGTLKRSIRRTQLGKDFAKIGTDQPYARIHNEGGTIPITAKMRKYFWAMYYKTEMIEWKQLAITKKKQLRITRNQFIGESAILARIIERQTLLDINKAIKL